MNFARTLASISINATFIELAAVPEQFRMAEAGSVDKLKVRDKKRVSRVSSSSAPSIDYVTHTHAESNSFRRRSRFLAPKTGRHQQYTSLCLKDLARTGSVDRARIAR